MVDTGMLALVLATAAQLGHHAALRWSVRDDAGTCIAADELAAAVSARLGGFEPSTAQPIRLTIDGEIAPRAGGNGWRATIDTRDERGALIGHRELDDKAADCRAIDDELVLVLALIIDPDLLDRPSPAPPPKPLPVVSPSTRAPHQRWQLAARAAGFVTWGLLPGIAAGTTVGASLEAGPWSIEVSGSLLPYDRAFATPGGAKLTQWTAGAALCPHLTSWASLCGGVQAGEIIATGFGFDVDEHRRDPIADATAELRLEWRVTRAIGIVLGAGAWIPLLRPRFVFAQDGVEVPVYQPASVAAVTQVALQLRF